MLVDLFLIVVFPLLGAFIVMGMRLVASGTRPGYDFGYEVALELIALSLGGLAAAAHNPNLSLLWKQETTTIMSGCFLGVFSVLIALLLLKKFAAATTLLGFFRDAFLGLVSLLILFAVILSGS